MIRRVEVYLTFLWLHLIRMVCPFPFYPWVQELLQEMVLRNFVGSLKTNPEKGENKQEYEASVQFDLSLDTSTFTSFPTFHIVCNYVYANILADQRLREKLSVFRYRLLDLKAGVLIFNTFWKHRDTPDIS